MSSRWVAGAFSGASERVTEYWRRVENSDHSHLLLDPGPGLHIVDVNDAGARATMTSHRAIAGRSLFEVFPDNPADPSADGVNNLFNSLQIAAETGQPHQMAIHRDDLRIPRANRRAPVVLWSPLPPPSTALPAGLARWYAGAIATKVAQ